VSIVAYEGRGGEIIETESTIEVQAPNASYAVIKATIDSQIATARAFPRRVKHAVNEVKTFATLTLDVAKSCVYALPRGGKSIEGPSARLAEILASCWGNLSVQGRVIEETDRYIVVTGECIDLERNNRRQVEVRRNIVDKYGKKYNADMVAMTANAAISIATRNAIFQVIPRALWEDSYQEVRKVIKGQLKPIEVERTDWLERWGKLGISQDDVLAALGVDYKEDITLDHVILMEGWKNAIDNNETSLHAVFPVTATSEVSQKVQAVAAKIAEVKTTAKPKPEPKAEAKTQDLPWEPGSGG